MPPGRNLNAVITDLGRIVTVGGKVCRSNVTSARMRWLKSRDGAGCWAPLEALPGYYSICVLMT